MTRLLCLALALTWCACGPEDAMVQPSGFEVGTLPHPHRRGAAAADGGALDICSMTSARSLPLEVFAAPDVAEQPFLDVISSAQQSLRVMVYQFTSSSIRSAVIARAQPASTCG